MKKDASVLQRFLEMAKRHLCPFEHIPHKINASCSGTCDNCDQLIPQGAVISECLHCQPVWWQCADCGGPHRFIDNAPAEIEILDGPYMGDWLPCKILHMGQKPDCSSVWIYPHNHFKGIRQWRWRRATIGAAAGRGGVVLPCGRRLDTL